MGSHDASARRRLIALLLARGEIGSGPPGGERRDEPTERAVAVDRDREPATRLDRREPAHRAG